MSFLIYVAMLIVVVSSLALGLDWVVSPPEAHPVAPASVRSALPSPPAPAPAVTGTNAPAARSLPAQAPAEEASRDAASPANAAPPVSGEKTTNAQSPQDSSDAAPDASPPPHCNVQACTDAYQSFRESDCTYQPYDGPRRLCGKK